MWPDYLTIRVRSQLSQIMCQSDGNEHWTAVYIEFDSATQRFFFLCTKNFYGCDYPSNGFAKANVSMLLFNIAYLNLVFGRLGESAHITHSAQSRTNVRKSSIICNMTWRETSCGYHRIPSTAPPWPDTIMTPYHKFRSSCSAFVNLHLLLHPVNMPPCKFHGLALSYFSWVTKWSMLEPCTVRWK